MPMVYRRIRVFSVYCALINRDTHKHAKEESRMKTSTRSGARHLLLRSGLAGLVLIAGFAVYPLTALQTTQEANGYIQGTVRSANGPEGGVWVIAETNDLPTKFIKIVVTDDQGR